MKMPSTIDQLVDAAFSAFAMCDRFGEQLAALNVEIARRLERRREDGQSSIQIKGRRSVCTVVWAERVEWDAKLLGALRAQMGPAFDALFRSRVVYEPTPALAEFLKGDGKEFEAARKTIGKARIVHDCKPAVRHRALVEKGK